VTLRPHCIKTQAGGGVLHLAKNLTLLYNLSVASYDWRRYLVPPTMETPPEYAHLARMITAAEVLLGHGMPPAFSLEAAAQLAELAHHAWCKTGNVAINELRVRANIIHGVAHAYASPANMRKAIRAATINVDAITPEPPSTVPSTLQLYALATTNSTVMRLLEASPELREEAWEQARIAQDFFGQVEANGVLPGIAHWEGVMYTAIAFLGARDNHLNEAEVQKYARLALGLLDERSGLRYLATYLLGRGDGRVPQSGWFGTNFRRRRAQFSVHDLYHFNDQS